MAEKCKECGCMCTQCSPIVQDHSDIHLHVEIEHLRQRLMERDSHIVTMETQFLNEADKFPNGEMASIREEILAWQDKYSRLLEAHKRVQKVNQNLEDKLLRIVDKCETEKGAFAKDIATLSHRLADANYTIHRLTQDNEKYRNDVNLAIQLLQCKPSNFVGQKYDTLPLEVQAKVRTYVAQKRRSSEVTAPDVKSITVPISTFPPTAMVYNVAKANIDKDSDEDNDSDESKSPVDLVSASIMAKVLKDRERERVLAKHCDTCSCHKSILTADSAVQTTDSSDICICKKWRMKDVCNVQTATGMNDNVGRTVESKDNFIKYDRTSLKNYERSDNFTRQPIFQETNDNTVNNSKGNVLCNNNENIKHSNFQCVNEKVGTKHKMNNITNIKSRGHGNQINSACQHTGSNTKESTSTKLSIRHQNSCKNQNDTNEQAPSQAVGNQPGLNKTRQLKLLAKKVDAQVGLKPKDSNWSKIGKNNWQQSIDVDTNNSDNNLMRKEELSRINMINDRLWKNEWWMKSKNKVGSFSTTMPERPLRTNHETQIDVINDRVWKNDSSRGHSGKPFQVTSIEVMNAIDYTGTNQNDLRQTVKAASPSFSSDSIVISTSDPPSSSSAPICSGNEKQSHCSNNLDSNCQDRRVTGPRNCLVRVTPGSKNILLDNAGHFHTVLYTSSSNRPNTALVHTGKSVRSARSASTSSEENSPILPQDNEQLQRVAEWVRSFAPVENSLSNYNTSKKISEFLPCTTPNDKAYIFHINACVNYEDKARMQKA
ncbi:putative uncharacterized protein DDB_G0282133 isoform X2 [Cephus cinctus]|uniref:Brain-enriched guanylate kinase-associated protein n=1 Tax=Cephus cinctus TaxID=211228 RepID=A0AAJ7BUB9_CEPCN|nr:putative uncharacterized protein DDB_G0282133 isoform X2 [Cephus cinctus]